MNSNTNGTTSLRTRPTGRTPRWALGLLLALTFLLVSCGTGSPGDGGPGLGSFDLDVVESSVGLAPGSSETVTVDVDRESPFVGSVDVTVDDLPAGVTAEPVTIAAGQTSADLVLTASGTAAPVDTEVVTVVGTSGTLSDSDVLTVSVGEEGVAGEVDEDVTAIESTEANLIDEPAIADGETLAPGQDRVYRLSVPTSDEPALFVFLDEQLDLYVYDGAGDLEATASSSEFFAAGTAGIPGTTATAGLGPQQISPTQDCPGTCVIMENPGSGDLFVRVVNPYDATATYSLHAALRSFDDANEAVATEGNPLLLEAGTTESGAIETLGDEDFYDVEASGTLFFDPSLDSEVDVVAEISDPVGGNPTRTVEPGVATDVAIGEIVRVYADDTPERAAVSANSGYILEHQVE